MATNSVTQPRTYYIYSLTDPRDNRVYYVGQTTNLRNRAYGHKTCGKANASGSPVYHRSHEIIQSGFEPIMTQLDSIVTIHRDIAMRLEACWIVEMKRRGYALYNSWCTGVCSNHNNPMDEIELVKPYALATIEELKKLDDILIRRVIEMLSIDW